MIQWLKHLIYGEPTALEDIISRKYIEHPMLKRTIEYSKNPEFWENYYKLNNKRELDEFARIINEYYE